MTQMRLRYAGRCARCGSPLAAGAEAIYDRATRTVHCVECPKEEAEGEPAEPLAIDPGVAGASAQREFDRRKVKRESRIKGRFGSRVGGWITALTDEPQSTRAWARGARGEREFAEALAGVEGIRVLHDRRVPGTPGNIDHLVVAPAGVFVVDAKRYEGVIQIRDVGRLFRTDNRLPLGASVRNQTTRRVPRGTRLDASSNAGPDQERLVNQTVGAPSTPASCIAERSSALPPNALAASSVANSWRTVTSFGSSTAR
jgi:hypothetical protein